MTKLLTFILLFLISFNVYSQKEMNGLKASEYNFSELSASNGSSLPHNAPCTDCKEVLSERKEDYRLFRGLGEDSTLVYSQTSYGPMHFKKNGNWHPIDIRPNKLSDHIYVAQSQRAPTKLDLKNGYSSVLNPNGEFTFNKNLTLIWQNGTESKVLAYANFSNYTIGDDGARIIDVFPGIDMEVFFRLGSIKTNFILKERPVFTEGSLIIRDDFDFPSDWNIYKNGDGLTITDQNGIEEFSVSEIVSWDDSDRSNEPMLFNYEINGRVVDMVLGLDILSNSELIYPITIDPIVNSVSTMAQAAIIGSGYNILCFNGYCTHTLNATVPPNAILQDIQWSFTYRASGLCYLSDGALKFTVGNCISPTAATYFWFCNLGSSGTCTGNNVSMWGDLGACMPAPSCNPPTIPVSMRFHRCFSIGTGCSNSCIGADSPYIITIIGRTVESASITANGATTTTVCSGAPVTLNATGAYGVAPYTFTWNPGGLTGSNITVNPTQTTAYTVTITDACNNSVNSTVNVNVTPAPTTPVLTSNSPLCVGQTLNLSSSVGGSIFWTGPNGFTSTAQNPTITNVTANHSGVYAAYIVVNGCTSATASHTVLVNSANTSATLTSNSPLCVGSSLNLNSSFTNMIWSGPNGFTSTLQNPTIPNISINDAGTYSAYSVANGCTSATSTLTVVVSANPVAPIISSNSPICSGQNINLNSNSSTGIVWSGPNTFSSTLQNPVITNAGVNASGNYNAYVVSNGCTSSISTINVVVNAMPTAPILGSNSPICVGSPINLTSNIPGVTWSGPLTYTSNLQNPTINSSATNMSGAYTAYVASNGCTSSTSTVNVIVNAVPSAPVLTTNPVCVGATLLLSSNIGSGIIWTGPNNYSSSIQNPQFQNAQTNLNGVYSAFIVQNGCSSAIATVTAVVNTNPPAPSITSNSPLCSGQSLQLSASPGSQFAWSGPNNFSSSLLSPTINNVSLAASGAYSVYSIANGCSTQSANHTVVINPLPAAPVLSSNAPICEGSNLQLNSNVPVGIYWMGPNNWFSTDQNPSILNAPTSYSGTYSAIAITGLCTSAVATQVVQVNSIPNPPFLTPSYSICEGSTFQLNGPTGNYQYFWSGPNGFTSNIQSPSISSANANQVGVYQLYIVSNGCSSGISNTQMTLKPLLSSDTSYSMCNGEEFVYNGVLYSNPGLYSQTFTGSNGCDSIVSIQVNQLPSPIAGFMVPGALSVLNPTAQIVDNSTNAMQIVYEWDGGTLNGPNPSIMFPGVGVYEIWQYVQNGNCKDSTSRMVRVNADMSYYIPNSFTPNKDDINDVFLPIIPMLKQYSILVFNRWGELMYSSDNVYEGWNGGFLNNLERPLESGVYVYRITFKDFENKWNDLYGHINLIR